MFKIVDIIVNIYINTPLSIRFCYAIWVLFINLYLYSSLYEKYNDKKIKREIKKLNWPYTLYILGAISTVIYYLSGSGEDAIFPLYAWGQNELSINIGFIIMVAGLAIVSFARAAIDGYWGPNIYIYKKDDTKLITTGIYALNRHPVYLGQILMTLGSVFMANQWILIFFPILTLIVNCIRASREDKELSDILGDEFTKYKNTVPFMFTILLRKF